jgi:hypothetical protein
MAHVVMALCIIASLVSPHIVLLGRLFACTLNHLAFFVSRYFNFLIAFYVFIISSLLLFRFNEVVAV